MSKKYFKFSSDKFNFLCNKFVNARTCENDLVETASEQRNAFLAVRVSYLLTEKEI